MDNDFIKKLANKEYISKYLFNNIKDENIIPVNFDIDKYNDNVLNELYIKYKDYFDGLYKNVSDDIHLDEEQIKAILSDEKYTLVIAGAGTGKTTTMVAKVKYLVDIKKVDPKRILVMSYTKKSTLELENRLVFDFNIPVDIQTFHSLGYKIVRNIYKNHFPYVVDENKRNEIFLDYFSNKIFTNKEKVKEIIELFDGSKAFNDKWIISNYFKDNYDKYNTFNEYFKAYKLNKIKAAKNSIGGLHEVINQKLDKDLNSESIFTIKNELVKSKGEAQIANFLFCNGIDYFYEKVYEEILPDYKIYKPDFTLNINGENVYIEYFGLSNYNDDSLNTYKKIKQRKEEYHKKHNNKFIKIDYKVNEDLIQNLEEQLIKMGFNLKPKTDEEIYEAILDRFKLSGFYNLKKNYYDVIDTFKSSIYRNNLNSIVLKYLNEQNENTKKFEIKQYSYILDFYMYYQKELYGKDNYGFDYSDMIYYAKTNINSLNSDVFNYDYIIIDEYQDISSIRYDFINNVINKNNSKLIVVGDDWQTIYSFSGSKIKYIYNFNKYFPNSKMFTISKTYRNSQELVNYAGEFIMKNDSQIKKELISDKSIYNPIRFISFDSFFEIDVLKKLIEKIHKENRNHNILILARTNKTIESLFNDKFFVDDVGTKIKIKYYNDLIVDGMSIHKSKGLSADEVIVIGLNNYFPILDKNIFWLKYLFMDRIQEELVSDAEERRVFYVALTRTKNKVYLLTNKDSRYRSKFLNELYQIINSGKH